VFLFFPSLSTPTNIFYSAPNAPHVTMQRYVLFYKTMLKKSTCLSHLNKEHSVNIDSLIILFN